jgi:hypothetical protein
LDHRLTGQLKWFGQVGISGRFKEFHRLHVKHSPVRRSIRLAMLALTRTQGARARHAGHAKSEKSDHCACSPIPARDLARGKPWTMAQQAEHFTDNSPMTSRHRAQDCAALKIAGFASWRGFSSAGAAGAY